MSATLHTIDRLGRFDSAVPAGNAVGAVCIPPGECGKARATSHSTKIREQ
ncbi:hypothetical protein AB0N05_27930 [Nocardia sp. NPDC051030]